MKFTKRATFNHSREDSPLVPCPECAIDMYWELLLRIGSTLAHNLAIAGALCRSFSLGHVRGFYRPHIDDEQCVKDEYEARYWRPGHVIDALRASIATEGE